MDASYLVNHYGLLKTRLFQRYPDVSVEDVVQETYFQALDSIRRNGPPSTPAAWLWVIAKRVIARQRLLTPPRYEVVTLDNLVGSLPEPWEVASSTELYDGVLHRLAHMNTRYRRLVKGRYLQGKPLYQLAKQLRLSAGSAKTQLWRARQSLRRTVKGWKT